MESFAECGEGPEVTKATEAAKVAELPGVPEVAKATAKVAELPECAVFPEAAEVDNASGRLKRW